MSTLVLRGLLLVVLVGRPSECRRVCSHHYSLPEELRYTNVGRISYTSGKRSLSEKEPLRLTPFYDQTVLERSKKEQQAIYDLIGYAVNYFSQTLNVQPVQKPFLLTRSCIHPEKGSEEELITGDFCLKTQGCTELSFCGNIAIPEEHLSACKMCDEDGRHCITSGRNGSGIANSDFVLYVSANDSNCDPSLIAASSHCQQISETDRPIAGETNLCFEALKELPIYSARQTVVHEIIHSLGFSPALYAFYRDEDGNPRTKRDKFGLPPISTIFGTRLFEADKNTIVSKNMTQMSIKGNFTVEQIFVTLPNVKKEARKYYGCPTMIGMELENEGGRGTKYAHWKQRIIENELMTGVETGRRLATSRFTLALLRDTGWYQVNYSMADPIKFGRCLGCDFVETSCFEYGLHKDPHCTLSDLYLYREEAISTLNTGCTFDRLSTAFCNMVGYDSDIPEKYQYFRYPNVGGRIRITDFCPYMEGLNSCQYFSDNTESDMDMEVQLLAEEYGPSSKCLNIEVETILSVSGEMIEVEKTTITGACYEVACYDNKVSITIQGKTHTCDNSENEDKRRVRHSHKRRSIQKVPIFSGEYHVNVTVHCPEYDEVCWDNSEDFECSTSNTDK